MTLIQKHKQFDVQLKGLTTWLAKLIGITTALVATAAKK